MKNCQFLVPFEKVTDFSCHVLSFKSRKSKNGVLLSYLHWSCVETFLCRNCGERYIFSLQRHFPQQQRRKPIASLYCYLPGKSFHGLHSLITPVQTIKTKNNCHATCTRSNHYHSIRIPFVKRKLY